MSTPLNWSAFEQVYSTAEIKESGNFKPLPTGRYTAQIAEHSFDMGKGVFERKFRILEGEFSGRTQRDWIKLFNAHGQPNEVSASRLRTEMAQFDLKLSQLPLKDSWHDWVEKTNGQRVEIWVKTQEDPKFTNDDGSPKIFSNVNINSFLDVSTAEIVGNRPYMSIPF